MNTLMHICCAPCANRPIAQLREEGLSVTGFWFNPNIHPYTEYQARKRTLEEYAREIGMKLAVGGTYDLRPFITAVAGDIDGRCAYCYRVRMEKTAQYSSPGTTGSICRSTAAVFSARRTGIWPPSGRKSGPALALPAGKRYTEITNGRRAPKTVNRRGSI